MNSTDIAEFFEQLAKTDISTSPNILTMRRLKEELAKRMPTLDAEIIVATTKIEVSNGFPENHKEDYDRCIVAFAEITVKVKKIIEEILGDKWKDAMRTNPLEFKINI